MLLTLSSCYSQLIPVYLKAFKAILSNPAYTSEWELFKYDDIMETVKTVAKQKQLAADKAEIDKLCREIDKLNI